MSSMNKVNSGQIKIIHTLLGRVAGLQAMPSSEMKGYKLELVKQYSNGRETSTTGLSYAEAAQMIDDLQKMVGWTPEQIQADRKRKLILSYAHQVGWELTDGSVDMEHVDSWCTKSGYLHKSLNDYTNGELSKLVWQMGEVFKSFLNAV